MEFDNLHGKGRWKTYKTFIVIVNWQNKRVSCFVGHPLFTLTQAWYTIIDYWLTIEILFEKLQFFISLILWIGSSKWIILVANVSYMAFWYCSAWAKLNTKKGFQTTHNKLFEKFYAYMHSRVLKLQRQTNNVPTNFLGNRYWQSTS